MNSIRLPRFPQCDIAQALCELETLSPHYVSQLDLVLNYPTPALRVKFLESVIEGAEEQD